MRFGNLADMSGRFARRGLTVAARAAAFLLAARLFAAPALEAQGTPAGTMIRSWAVVTYENANAKLGVATSDTVSLLVGQVAGVDVEPPRASTGAAGTTVVFAHSIANVGNGADSFTVAVASSRGWPVTLYRDANANGTLDGADSPLAGPVALGYGGTARLLVRVAIPNIAGVPGMTDSVAVTATSRFDGAVSDAVLDRLDAAAPFTISLNKQVDRPTAVVGDLLTYTLSYTAAGLGTASGVELADTIPAGTAYVPGTLRWNGVPLTDAVGDDAGFIAPAGNGAVVFAAGTMTSGETGSVTFQVQVGAGPARMVDNQASTTFAWDGGSVITPSNTVHTSVLVAALSLEKQLTSAPLARIGEPVGYTLRYGNALGGSPVQSLVVSDTLPAGLDYVSASSAPAVSVDGRVLTWAVGDLAAGASGAIDVALVVASSVRDTVRVRNLGFALAQGTAPLSAAAAELTLVGPPSAVLGLELSADVLEVGVGEAIPYAATLKNTGIVTLTDLQIVTRLPAGARFAPASVGGADSVHAAGDQLVLFTAAPLAPGASRTLRYVAALTSASGRVAESRATASGQASTGQAFSPEAIAWVRVRRDWPMETRAAIGKVWVDTNGDGIQGAGEAGLSGIDLWSEDGLVASTDEQGKFSFTNMRPGRHAFRLDPQSLPEGYALVGDAIQIVEASGWTTPHVDFRVVPLPPSAPRGPKAGTGVGQGAALEPAAAAPADTERVTVPAARTAAQREAERRAAFMRGPGIAIFAPADGAVLSGDRVYVGVKGEASAKVVLYDGATPIDTVQTRVDGVFDFIAVPLARGPHLVRVSTKNSWGQERWDSIAVHVTGLPARFEVTPTPMQLVADGRSQAALEVRVLDAWGVPVAQPAYVTVSAKGAEPAGEDADRSSVGVQLLSGTNGRLAIQLLPGREVGPGTLDLKSGDATAKVPLQLLPEVRGLTVTGSGMVGVGASPDAYGAVTARGRLDQQTSLTLGVDSRRLNAGRDVFGRSADPLEESQYPIFGDASHMQTRTASRNWLSARVERGYNWAAFGDLSTKDFAGGLGLAEYRRSVTGLAGHLTTGAVTWGAFGSLTSQTLRTLQIRGAGVSGPYQLAADILAGSEYLRIETRALDNPERAIASQALTRFVDYQIDYATGALLFKQPIPAADQNGNHLFIVATFEAASGGEQRLVAGARAAVDVRQLRTTAGLDSLRLGFTAVSANEATTSYQLLGTDVRALRVGKLDVGAEAAYSAQGDSAGVAIGAKASYTAFDGALTLGAGFMQVSRGFTNPSNVAVRPGVTDVNLKGGFKVGGTELRAEHTRQEFGLQGVDRTHTRFSMAQAIAPNVEVDAGVANDRIDGAGASSEATTAEIKTKWGASDRLGFWTEARRHLSLSGAELWPDVWGFGGAYKVTDAVALEASQRYVSRPDSSGDYSVSSLGVRANVAAGTEAWGNYQLTGGASGVGNAAIVGLRNRMQLTPALAVNALFERRVGVGRAALGDPVRALPFMQAEDDYWSLAAGAELLPTHAPYRLSARGEYKDGTLQSSRLVTLAGDVAFDASLALLSRQEFMQNERPAMPLARRLSSVWGLAFRPAKSDRLNMLAKLQWSDEHNPIGGGVLVARGAERKLIGAAEMIWTPVPELELGTRYAMRRTVADRVYNDGTPLALTAWADYVGTRANLDLTPWVSLRADGRVLVERTSGTTRWDGAPALAVRPVKGLEVAAGYRFGDLTDPDFSVRGGHGAFVTLSAALTEKLFPTAAEFWRRRF